MTEHDARDGGSENRELQEARLTHQDSDIVPTGTWQAYNLDTLNLLLDP